MLVTITTADPLIDFVSPNIDPLAFPSVNNGLSENGPIKNRSLNPLGPVEDPAVEEESLCSLGYSMGTPVTNQRMGRGFLPTSMTQNQMQHDLTSLFPIPLQKPLTRQALLNGVNLIHSKEKLQELMQVIYESSHPLEEAIMVADDLPDQCNNLTASSSPNHISLWASNDYLLSHQIWNIAGWSAPSNEQLFKNIYITI